MSIIRIQKEEKFSVIDNQLIEDKSISWQAKGMLVYLLHLPNDWEIKVEHLKNQSVDGRDCVNNIIKELINSGYIQRDTKGRKKGKFLGYNYVISERPQKTTTVTGFPLRSNRNGLTVTGNPEILSTNLLSTNKEKISDETTKPSNSNSFLSPFITKIFEIILPIGEFPHSLPEDGENPTLLLMKAQRFIKSFQEKNMKDYELDEKWIKANHIQIPEVSDENELLALLKKSCSRYATMKKEGYWPYDKKPLAKSIDTFFYNPRTKKSWFLYCLCNRPKSLQNEAGEKLKESVLKEIQDERDKVAVQEYKKEGWNDSVYWKKIREMYYWVKKIGMALYTYNQGGAYCLSHLLDYIKDFQSTWPDWSLSNFGIGNPTWKLFMKWMKKERGINLEPEKMDLIYQCEHIDPDFFNDKNIEWKKFKEREAV